MLLFRDFSAICNQRFMLTCNIGTNSGNAVVWIRNGVVVVTVRISDCFTADIRQGLSSSYEYNCTTSNKRYNLIIPASMINSEGGSRWKCEDSGGGGSSSTYFLQFYNPPTRNPVVSGYDGSVRYKSYTLPLTCQVSSGSPLATLSWTFDGQLQNVNPSVSGTTVTSALALTLQKGHNGKMCTCHGRHSDTIYTPDISNMTFIGTLECTSKPVNPPTITHQWIRENDEIQEETRDRPVINIGRTPAYVHETKSFERPCTADGNPTPVKTWTPNINPSNGVY
ncbi:hypothetical protein KUTeg_006445 [Tegillarca granosa]|uniref:Ig-like domain-containing protein n=1 Tax=Tegillarca granosa TaxID=220873 RepID=A0ABQ9FGI4_TEGGR|nr:hypothetical protein KUTeg_006445 [Tegillarca granosa]